MLNAINLSALAGNSLKSIDNWLETIQSNIGGTTRTAFKQSELYYGPSTTYTLREPTNERAGEMLPELSMSTGYTKVDWSQGTVVYSTQNSHFAVQGDGFFVVQELTGSLPNASLVPPVADKTIFTTYDMTTGTPNAGGGDVYLTRDGEFHWGIHPNDPSRRVLLLDQNGMMVLSDHGDSNNFLGPVSLSDYYETTDPTYFKVRPSIVKPSLENDRLQFSKYGSTYLKYLDGVPITGNVIVEGAADRFASADGQTLLIDNALEASNTEFEKNITEMVVLTKVYNSMVQVIKVYNTTLDEILGFIR